MNDTPSNSQVPTAISTITNEPPTHEPSDVHFGRRITSRYVVIEQIGQGGMGRVFRAYDPKLEREVALKVLRHRVLDERAQARLVREARAMAKLSHPNVVSAHDVEDSPASTS